MAPTISKRLVLRFPTNLLDKPIIHQLTTEYNLVFNIHKAHIIPNKEGLVVLELTGNPTDMTRALKMLDESKVIVEQLAQDIVRDDEECVQCGLCVAYCPTGALYYEMPDRLVQYDNTKCVACEECVRTCPTHAFSVKL
jgi:ferredoxin